MTLEELLHRDDIPADVLAVLRAEIAGRERTTSALQMSEGRFRRLFENSPMGIFVYSLEPNQDLILLDANPAASSILGVDCQEFIGRTLEETFPPLADTAIPNAYRDVARNGGVWHDEQVSYADDRIVGAYDVHAFRTAPSRVAVMFLDITDRRAAEERLRESEERFRLTFEHSAVGVVSVDPSGAILQANPAFGAIIGRTKDELQGLDVHQLTHPEDVEAEEPLIGRVLTHEQDTYSMEKRFLRPDGTPVWARVTSSVLRDSEGTATMAIGVVEDIGQQRAARQREALLTGRLHVVVDIANELLACDDEGAVFRTCVERARERLGVERCAIFLTDGDAMRGAYGTDDKGNTTDEHEASFLRQERWGEALVSYADADSPRWLAHSSVHGYFSRVGGVTIGEGWVVYTPIQTYGRVPIGVMVNDAAISGGPIEEDLQEILAVLCTLLCNVVERRRLEEEQRGLEAQILRSQKLESLGVLAGGIAHDFNNILMGVLGNASLALAQLSPVSPARSCIERVESSALRAADLAKQMLAYSGKGRFVIQTVDMADLIDEMTHLLEASISKKAVLHRDLTRGEARVDGDVTQLRQLLLNLVLNASDALGDDAGVITIRTGRTDMDEAYLADTFVDDRLPGGAYAFAEVSDTGCGMDEETRTKVFDPFFSTKRVGRGLGMAAVLGIARGHHGALKVYSEPGRGTTVRILIPLSQEPPEAMGDAAAAAPRLWQARGSVLVVDDEETVRQVAAATLAMVGLSALLAVDGEDGLRVFKEKRDSIVAVVLDMSMPKMGGEEVFHELRRLGAEVPVILSSGFNEQDATNCLAGRGIAGFIQKPYRPTELLEKLRVILGV